MGEKDCLQILICSYKEENDFIDISTENDFEIQNSV